MALIDLTDVRGLINDVKRNLYLDDSATVKFISVSTVLLEVTEKWYLDKNPVADLAEQEYHLLSIADNGSFDLDSIIPMTTSIKVGDLEYSSYQYNRSREETNVWKVKVQTQQMMKRDI